MPATGLISVYLGAEDLDQRRDELNRIAAEVGAIGKRGPSISALLQMIADGELIVIRAQESEGIPG
jgi:hypothetical protein